MKSHVAAYDDPVQLPLMEFLEPDESMLPPRQPARAGRRKGSKGKPKQLTVNGKEKGPRKRSRYTSNGEFNHTARFNPPQAGGSASAAAVAGAALATACAGAAASAVAGTASGAGTAGGSASGWSFTMITAERARPSAVANPYKTRGESAAAAGAKRKVPAYM
jgi:hypothetical protein